MQGRVRSTRRTAHKDCLSEDLGHAAKMFHLLQPAGSCGSNSRNPAHQPSRSIIQSTRAAQRTARVESRAVCALQFDGYE